MRRVFTVLFLVVAQIMILNPGVSGEKVQQENLQLAKEKVQWMEWGDEAFHRAEGEDKLILLDLTAVWCHACHVMEETTYADQSIITLLSTRFVPIRVDTDLRPDIDSRYRSGGWPTTSILLPTGEILFQANALGPEELGEALRESDQAYRHRKEDLMNRAQEIWQKVEEASKAQISSNTVINPEIVEQSVFIMRKHYDQDNGGFRDEPKFFESEAVTLIFQLVHRKANPSLQRMALFTLDKQRTLVDPVWGGFYRYAEKADWGNPHYEKMLNIQALNLENYLEAYQVTGDSQYKETVDGIINYVTRFLSDQKNGGFYASQDADLRFPNDPDAYMSGESYFALKENQRLALGIPPVDKAVYTGWNGLMAKGYLKAYQVLGVESLREFAEKTLNRLYQERYRQGLGVAHSVTMGNPMGFSLLSDQVFFASALLEASISTGEVRYLDRAEKLVEDLTKQLEDSRFGGFHDRPVSSQDRGLLKFPQKPLEENVQAARLLCDLYYLTEKQRYRDLAERTLQYVLGAPSPYPVAMTALAADRFLHYPVHVVVVGSKASNRTLGLFREGLRLYAPGKIVRLLDPTKDSLRIGEVTFPNIDSPRAYICTDRLCSPPIQDPGDLEGRLAEVIKETPLSDISDTAKKNQG